MKKRIISLLLAVLCIASLFAACSKTSEKQTDASGNNQTPGTSAQSGNVPEDDPSGDPGNVPSDPNSGENPGQTEYNPGGNTGENPGGYTRVTNEEKVARDFVDALLKKNYDAAINLTVAGAIDRTFISTADVEWAVPRTDFKDLQYFDADTTEYTTELTSANQVTVSLKDGKGEKQSFSVRVAVPDGEADPKVDASGTIYVKNCTIRCSGGVKVEIDGVEVTNDYLTARNVGRYNLSMDYKFPFIGRKDKTLRLYCDNFDANMTFTPEANNSVESEDAKLRFSPSYEGEDEFDIVKDLWNNMYNALKEKNETSSLNQYIAADASADLATLIADSYSELDKDCTYQVTQVVHRQETRCFWASDHIVVVNFGYELTWKDKYSNSHTMRDFNAMFIAKEGDEWKVYYCPYYNFFSNNNYMISRW